MICAQPARFLHATLGLDGPPPCDGDALPPLWHWLYFLSAEPRNRLGRDGHPKKGGFLPPVELPRRMWGGGRFTFHRPLIIGEMAVRHSRIADIRKKDGRSGRLCFVTVHHEISGRAGVCLTEDHDIVYREDPKPGMPSPAPRAAAPPDAEFTTTFLPDPVLLFRYSALTFNGHRIHYDRDYARNVEHYRDLVFHGPLVATLLSGEAMRRDGKRALASFSFRAHAPLFADREFTLNGKPADKGFELWAAGPDGALAVTAIARFRDQRTENR